MTDCSETKTQEFLTNVSCCKGYILILIFILIITFMNMPQVLVNNLVNSFSAVVSEMFMDDQTSIGRKQYLKEIYDILSTIKNIKFTVLLLKYCTFLFSHLST
jgi:hypothetical protein